MRGDCALAQLHHEIGSVIGFVGPKRNRVWPVGARLDQRDRRQPLGVARGTRRHPRR